MENVIKTEVSVLRRETVRVRAIRRPSDWLPEGHDSQFMNEGAKWNLCVPTHAEKKVLVDPLTGLSMEQKEDLARRLGLENASSFNVYRKDNYWRKFEIPIDKNGRVLNLSDPYDYVIYRVLQCNTDWIAPSWAMRFMKGTYKFALEHESDKIRTESDDVSNKERAYLALNKMGNSRTLMSDFLWAYYLQVREARRPPVEAPLDWLKNEIGKIIDSNIGMFLSIIEDPDYPYKVLIVKSLNVGALTRDGDKYRFPGGEFSIGTLDQMVAHLKDDRYQDDYLKLKTKIEVAEKTTLKSEINKVDET